MDDLISREQAIGCLSHNRMFDETDDELIAMFTRRISQLPAVAVADIDKLAKTYEKGFMDGFEAHRELIKKGKVNK